MSVMPGGSPGRTVEDSDPYLAWPADKQVARAARSTDLFSGKIDARHTRSWNHRDVDALGRSDGVRRLRLWPVDHRFHGRRRIWLAQPQPGPLSPSFAEPEFLFGTLIVVF